MFLPLSASSTRAPLSPLIRCIPVQTVTCLLVLELSSSTSLIFIYIYISLFSGIPAMYACTLKHEFLLKLFWTGGRRSGWNYGCCQGVGGEVGCIFEGEIRLSVVNKAS